MGLVSKLDVYRAELQASQAQESMLRAEASLDSELERFRTLLGLSPSDPLQPEALVLPEDIGADDIEPVEVLTQRALENRLDLLETRDEVGDARRTASLAKQNLLPQLDLNLGVTQFGTGTTYGNAFTFRRPAGQRLLLDVLSPGALERAAANRRWPSSTSPRASARCGRGSSRWRRRSAPRCASCERIRKSIELQRKGGRGRRAAAAAGHPALSARARLQLRRGGRGGQPGRRAQRAGGLLTSYQVAKVDLLRVTGTLAVDKDFAP